MIHSTARFLLLLLAMLAAGSPSHAASGAVVYDPWVREAPPNAMALAGYMVLENRSGEPIALVGASSPAFQEVTIHRTQVKDGVAAMVHEEKIEIAPGARLVFEPGGYHLMLMGPRQPLRAGETLNIDLKFRGGAKVPVRFTVRRAVADRSDHKHD